jgi:hypothetical protein
MVATLEIHFLTLKYTHCQFRQNYPKKVAKIKLILAKLAFATNYEVCFTYNSIVYSAIHSLVLYAQDTLLFKRGDTRKYD